MASVIKHRVQFKAEPGEVFDLLMNPKKHEAFTGDRVTISKKPGAKFTVFNGYVNGYNIELAEGEKIVQGWSFAEEGWPKNHFSTCTFRFEKSPAGTILRFEQTGVPDHLKKSISNGWKKYYWAPMKQFLKDSKA